MTSATDTTPEPVAQDPSAASALDPVGYGGFSLGGMALALPMATLREVQPCQQLWSLPCAVAAVVGGIDLRGTLVPVLDLRLLLGRPAPAQADPVVVIVVHGGHILGLLADTVTGVFSTAQAHWSAMRHESADSALLMGSLRREDDASLVSVLSAPALLAWPGLPSVRDPEPQRQALAQQGTEGHTTGESTRVPLMLLRCGVTPLAIDALAVHATVSDPVLERSVLAQGHCRGTVRHGGELLPAVDLASLLGLGGQRDPQQPWQAFVVRLTPPDHSPVPGVPPPCAGLVALLVDQVIDVQVTRASDRLSVPPWARIHPELLTELLPCSVLPPDVVQRAGVNAAQFLVLDGQALQRQGALRALAQTQRGRPATGEPGQRANDSATATAGAVQPGQRAMITYALAGESATPIEQVQEILPFTLEVVVFQQRGALLGMLAHRGQSIPVVCLSRLLGLGPVQATPAASVLVVACEGQLTGFAVPALRTIDAADWEPEMARTPQASAGADLLAQALASRRLARVGQGDARRMLRVVDLQQLARGLHASTVAEWTLAA